MNDAKHTPGPWEIEPKSDTLNISARDGKRKRCIARLQRSASPYHHNARLIAAGPDLLEAAEAIDAYWSSELRQTGVSGDDLHMALRAAIAKARGES